jgi:hypothetical protein
VIATRTCSYCGRENEESLARCPRCGTDLSSKSQPPRNSSVLSNRLRVALAGIGILGGLLWFILGAFVLIAPAPPDARQGGMSDGELALCIMAILIAFIYYAIVSSAVWSRNLLWVGIGVHVLWAAAVLSILGLTGGGFLLLPVFLAGAACWIGYAVVTPVRGS